MSPWRRRDLDGCGQVEIQTVRILLHLDLPHRPPRVSPARGPPQAELHFDPSPAFDLAAPDAAPEFEFDQSSPQDLEI